MFLLLEYREGVTGKTMKKFLFCGFFYFSLFLCSCTSAGKVGSDSYFMNGFDASMVSQVEENGGVYKDFDGKEEDVFDILKKAGINWIRLRLWLSPDQSLPGNNTIERTLNTARRIKEKGLNFLLDIHFSDTWADPAQQKRPAEWDEINSISALSEKVYEYTYGVLNTLNDFPPDMIQIGNEINAGMLVTLSTAESIEDYANPSCSSWKSDETILNLERVLKSASGAVRDFNSDIKIMIHLSSQEGDNLLWWFNRFKSVDFDLIGLSYYPYYSHGSLEDLAENIKNLKKEFSKDLVVVESAYAWTDDWGDDTDNLFGEESKTKAAYNLQSYLSEFELTEAGGIEASVNNQKAVISLIRKTVKESGGKGFFYWGGDWLLAEGIENNWENQALFDFKNGGKALKSLMVE